MLLFCKRLVRNVSRFKTHVQQHCSAHWTFCWWRSRWRRRRGLLKLPIYASRPDRYQWDLRKKYKTKISDQTGTYERKIKRKFPIKLGQPRKVAHTIFYYYLLERNRATNRSENLKYSGRTEPKRTIPFDFQPKFPESVFCILLKVPLYTQTEWEINLPTIEIQ